MPGPPASLGRPAAVAPPGLGRVPGLRSASRSVATGAGRGPPVLLNLGPRGPTSRLGDPTAAPSPTDILTLLLARHP